MAGRTGKIHRCATRLLGGFPSAEADSSEAGSVLRVRWLAGAPRPRGGIQADLKEGNAGTSRRWYGMMVEAHETILIVDDEESIRGVVGEYLRRRGYQVVTAGDGAQALDLLQQGGIDCCFTDINMPGMNGLDLAERIHATDSALPVIVMTGYPTLDVSIHTLRNGVVDFLIKPVNLKQMEISLRRAIQQRAMLMENMLLKQEVKGKERLEKLNQELLHKIDELDTANRIMAHFSATASVAHAFQRAVDIALEVVPADCTRFFVVGGPDGRPHEVAAARRQPEAASFPPISAAGVAGGDLTPLVKTVSSDAVPLLAAAGSGQQHLPARIGSLLAVPIQIRGKVFGVLTAEMEGEGRRFTEKDLFYLSFTTQSAGGAIETLALYENLYENLFATLYGFVNALEARDLYTRQHSTRVTEIALVLGRELQCSGEELNILNFAGPLHDIGKIGIRDEILLKPGRLTAEEFEKIKEHPVIGANMITQLGLWERERQIIRCHHERFDGTGYPDGLCREEIPFLARILSVADAYDAMASDRAYRQRMAEGLILEIIRKGAGSQFDPRIVEVFQKAYSEGKITRPAAMIETENFQV
jgi:putative nucleotidyltransferase with HDIG domain